jgi:hypothetical protein
MQCAGIALAIALGVTLHWANDGLWFQGDSPRHALTGLFVWDLLTEAPTSPIEYAASYYARYPAIVAGAYPPLLYLLEAPVFRVFGPSPYAAKALVWAFAALTAIYVMLWGRHFVARWAGWAGTLVLFVPGFVRYSNGVLLNVPGTALGVAALYHLQRWLDERRPADRALFAGFAVATVSMYIPAGIVFLIAAAWGLMSARRPRGWLLWLPTAVMLAALVVIAVAIPAYMARQAPSVERFLSVAPWAYYARRLPGLLGLVWPWLGIAGLVIALLRPTYRAQAIRLSTAAVTTIAALATLTAADPRYALILAPVCVLAACLGITALIDRAGQWRHVICASALMALLGVATTDALRTRVPRVSGVEEAARYLAVHGASDAVLYSGIYDGVFTFYVRALDHEFHRRVVLSNKLLYRYEMGRNFTWVETPFVTSSAQVVALIASQSGCNWIAVEALPEARLTASERLLRDALRSPEFEHVKTFQIQSPVVSRIDLYRLRGPVTPVNTVDLSFPSFSGRIFRGVVPVERSR